MFVFCYIKGTLISKRKKWKGKKTNQVILEFVMESGLAVASIVKSDFLEVVTAKRAHMQYMNSMGSIQKSGF